MTARNGGSEGCDSQPECLGTWFGALKESGYVVKHAGVFTRRKTFANHSDIRWKLRNALRRLRPADVHGAPRSALARAYARQDRHSQSIHTHLCCRCPAQFEKRHNLSHDGFVCGIGSRRKLVQHVKPEATTNIRPSVVRRCDDSAIHCRVTPLHAALGIQDESQSACVDRRKYGSLHDAPRASRITSSPNGPVSAQKHT